MIKRIFVVMMMVMAFAVNAEVISSSESVGVPIDSRIGTKYSAETNVTYSVQWDSTWVGENESAEVVIADNGVELKRATGSGEFDYTVIDYEPHVLTYTTYIGGVAQEEVYTATFNAIDCEGMGVPGLQRATFTGNAYDASHIALGGEPIVTLDGEGMYDSNIGTTTTYVYSGYMYFRGGETYTFRAYFDDYSSVMVDNQMVVAKNGSECKEGTGTISFETYGWRKVEFRVSNNSGAGGLVIGAAYQGVWYQTDADTTWRKIVDDGSGTVFRTGPDYCGVVILKAAMRPSDPTIMDVVYKVVSQKETVKVRALAYEDGNRSFANAVPVLSFADGTEANIGDNVPANKELTLSWQVAADWATDLSKVRFEVMVMDEELLPIHFVTIPKTANHAAIKYSDTVLTTTPIMNALYWLYASQTEGLTLTNGRLAYNGTELAKGTSVSNPAATVGWLYGLMGYSVLSGEDLEYVKAAARISLSPSGIRQFAAKTIEE